MNHRKLFHLALGAMAMASAPRLVAQEFALVVSPPRIESRVKANETYRNNFELTNTSARAAKFTFETADWLLDANDSPVFSQALAKNSCRPWVAIEARELTIRGNSKRRFRFEATVPADAPRGECRFAIMVEGEPQAPRAGLPMPVSGRIAVIVYLAVGAAAPNLVVLGVRSVETRGARLPLLTVRNEGDQTARLEGYVAGLDASQQRFTLVPDSNPILPGATREIPLRPMAEADGKPVAPLNLPIRVKGRLDADRQRVDIDAVVDR